MGKTAQAFLKGVGTPRLEPGKANRKKAAGMTNPVSKTGENAWTTHAPRTGLDHVKECPKRQQKKKRKTGGRRKGRRDMLG